MMSFSSVPATSAMSGLQGTRNEGFGGEFIFVTSGLIDLLTVFLAWAAYVLFSELRNTYAVFETELSMLLISPFRSRSWSIFKRG
jgi:hypothetical protein